MSSSRKRRIDYDLIFDAVRTVDRPVQFLEILCDKENAIAGSYWSTDNPFSKGTFVLKAVHGRPEAQEIEGIAKFHIDEPHVFTKDAIERQSTVIRNVAQGRVGRCWSKKSYTKDLRKLGVRRVLVVPVFDSFGEPNAVYSLYYGKHEKINASEVYHVCQVHHAAAHAAQRTSEIGRLERAKSRHEILGHSRIIAEKLDGISKDIAKAGPYIDEFETVDKRFKDAIRSARILQHSFTRGTFKERVLDRSRNSVWFSVSKSLNNCLQAASSEIASGASILKGRVPETNWEVEFFQDDFQMLFSNVFSNAFKYSAPGSVIRTTIKEFGGELEVSVRNDVEVARDDDLKEIFKYEVRGAHALNSKIPGHGIGLGLVSDIASVYGLVAGAGYTSDSTKSLTKVFNLRISLPKELYRVGDNGRT